ncbi:MAG: twin-arginine translocase TatA/TatE family subunit [Candidatus Gastranaerophilales bacterium]|nr:twin-arginine translocase TatA/TatE family subunit [Candidatus Gastranaerophilales bacterium]
MSLGITEITLILVVILLLFGGKRIPELARALGKASYEYKKAKSIIKKEADEIKDAIEEAQEKPEEYSPKDV